MANRRMTGRGVASAGALVLLLAAPGRVARARVYAEPVLVESEEDLDNYAADGVLDSDDLDTLRELYHNPLDINRASRLELYELPGVSAELARAIVRDRRENGAFSSPSRLLRVPGMTPAILEEVRPFVQVVAAPVGRRAYSGLVRGRLVKLWEPVDPVTDDSPYATHTAAQLGKEKWPAGYLKTRVNYGEQVEAGLLGVMDDKILWAEYDPDSHDISAKWGSPALELGKLYGSWERGHAAAIAGSYTAGFGLGLTFDTTTRRLPHGWYPDLTVYVNEDSVRLHRGQFGAAGRLVEWRPGAIGIDATLFLSSTRQDIYQYDMGIAGGEDVDPLVDDLDSPRVFVEGQRVGWVTIPNAYRESIAGLNVTLDHQLTTQVGFTGWVGHLDTTALRGSDDPDDWVIRSGFPDADTYGAVGVNAAHGAGPVDLLAEVSTTSTGGTGALVEAIYGADWGTVETSLRRYDTDFDNPHARGIAAPDEYGGMRDRDEQGARVEVDASPLGWLDLRVKGDYWRNLAAARDNAEIYGRARATLRPGLWVALLGDHVNRDLAHNGRTRIYGGDDVSAELLGTDLADPESYVDETATVGATSDADVVDRAGTKSYLGAQVGYAPVEAFAIQAFYKRIYEDAGLVYPNGTAVCEPWYQVGQYTWIKVSTRPRDGTRASWRLRYRDDDIWGSRDDRNLETYLEGAQDLPYRTRLTVRGTLGWDLADPPAPWAEACASGGVPDTVGTCVVDSAQDDGSTVEGSAPYALLQATFEGRF